MKREIWKPIVSKFVDLLSQSGMIRTAIVDGSVRTGEFVSQYSDVDLKVFLRPRIDHKAAYRQIADSIILSVKEPSIRVNVWCMPDCEFPSTYPKGMFDFVHRHVLAQGAVVLGEDRSAQIERPSRMSAIEYGACVAAMERFLLRLRRLYINPLAVSDVTHLSASHLTQQAIAYYFHSLRYYNASHGRVTPPINDNIHLITASDKSVDTRFAHRLYQCRSNWNIHRHDDIAEAKNLLLDTISAIEAMRNAASNNTIPNTLSPAVEYLVGNVNMVL